jgi:hypothetical protein
LDEANVMLAKQRENVFCDEVTGIGKLVAGLGCDHNQV